VAASTRSDLGLFVLRLGVGLQFVTYGLRKLLGGGDAWAKVGSAMANLGLDFWPTFWGFCATLTELCGGILLALGLLFRPTAGLLAFVMLVAAIKKAVAADGILSAWTGMGHPFALLVVSVALAIIGPGYYALDRRYRMTLTNRIQRKQRTTTMP